MTESGLGHDAGTPAYHWMLAVEEVSTLPLNGGRRAENLLTNEQLDPRLGAQPNLLLYAGQPALQRGRGDHIATAVQVEQFIESARFYLTMANKIDWDTPVMRTYRCTEMHGRMRVDCTFKDLCRFGGTSAGKYVLHDGRALRKYKPQPGAEKMPWE